MHLTCWAGFNDPQQQPSVHKRLPFFISLRKADTCGKAPIMSSSSSSRLQRRQKRTGKKKQPKRSRRRRKAARRPSSSDSPPRGSSSTSSRWSVPVRVVGILLLLSVIYLALWHFGILRRFLGRTTQSTSNPAPRVKELATEILSYGVRSHPADVNAGLGLTRDFIASTLRAGGSRVWRQNFTKTKTPIGPVRFQNIVGIVPLDGNTESSDSDDEFLRPSQSEIVLACHYESKKFDFEFVGACDSAVPCAMLLQLSEHVGRSMETVRRKIIGNSKVYVPGRKKTQTLDSIPRFRFLFFDGEESFGTEWTLEDSLYGSKEMADHWQVHDARVKMTDSKSKLKKKSKKKSTIASPTFATSVEAFILLDLIGGPDGGPLRAFEDQFPSGSAALFRTFARLEMEIFGSIEVFRGTPRQKMKSHVEDDHMPFLRAGFQFPIAHLIPVPFPSVWHRFDDDLEHIEWGPVGRLQAVLVAFVDEKLGINSKDTR